MATFKVISVIDGDTIKVSPNFQWTTPNGQLITNDTVRILGYLLPNKQTYGYQYAKQKLEKLLLNRPVVLTNIQLITEFGQTWNACNVLVDNVDVSTYFPEYRVR